MYDEFEKSGFDSNSLEKYGEYICVIAGIEKFKLLLGNEFATLFNNLFEKIKAMPKVHLILLDSIDGIKKMEFDSWYKAIISTSRAIWIGDGIANQFTIKSTLPARQLMAKIDNDFGYYIDGSTTVLLKVITEEGEEDEYEVL